MADYRKWRRIFMMTAAVNFLFSALQMFFAVQHLIKHEYWLTLVSLSLFALNFWVGIMQTKSFKRVKIQEKQKVWDLLKSVAPELGTRR